MYRVVDNEDGSIIAICFSEEMANKILSLLPSEEMEPGFYRFAWENCLDHPSMIGNTFSQLGEHISMHAHL